MPSIQQLIRVAMDAVVRRFIWMLPKPVLILLLVAGVTASYFYCK